MADTYEVKVRPDKVAAVEDMKQSFEAASTVVLTEYRGLTVTEIGQLRRELTKAEVRYRVVKNTLARRAATDAGFEGLDELFVGPTAVAYCHGDPVQAAKTLSDFARDHPALVIKGAVFEGRLMSPDETEALARVDPLDTSRAKIMFSLQGALQQIVGILEAPLSRILFVIEQGIAQGAAGPFAAAEAPAAEAPAADAEPEAEAEQEAEQPSAEEPKTEDEHADPSPDTESGGEDEGGD